MAQRERIPSPHCEMSAVPSPEELAQARFGNTDGLAIVTQTTLELAAHYASRFKLPTDDPEVSLITAALAFSRHKEFTLLVELERDLHSRVSLSLEDETYGQVLFNVTRTGAYKEIHKELDRLHSKGGQYLRELTNLAEALGPPPEED